MLKTLWDFHIGGVYTWGLVVLLILGVFQAGLWTSDYDDGKKTHPGHGLILRILGIIIVCIGAFGVIDSYALHLCSKLPMATAYRMAQNRDVFEFKPLFTAIMGLIDYYCWTVLVHGVILIILSIIIKRFTRRNEKAAFGKQYHLPDKMEKIQKAVFLLYPAVFVVCLANILTKFLIRLPNGSVYIHSVGFILSAHASDQMYWQALSIFICSYNCAILSAIMWTSAIHARKTKEEKILTFWAGIPLMVITTAFLVSCLYVALSLVLALIVAVIAIIVGLSIFSKAGDALPGSDQPVPQSYEEELWRDFQFHGGWASDDKYISSLSDRELQDLRMYAATHQDTSPLDNNAIEKESARRKWG